MPIAAMRATNVLDIVATGNYYASLGQEDTLPDLQDALKSSCKERYRRIDRFIQLCLIGSASCKEDALKKGIKLNEKTGLYIGSRYGPLGNTTQVHRQMMRSGEIPKPAHFINTLSNSSGYFVARNLGLSGKNLFVSRGDCSLEAALDLASLDLHSREVDQALVGIVEEGIIPATEQRQRLDLSPNEPLAEGSHWFLLHRCSKATISNPIESSARPVPAATLSECKMFSDHQQLEDWLESCLTSDPTHIFTNNSESFTSLENKLTNKYDSIKFDPPPRLNAYPARIAGVLCSRLETKDISNSEQIIITLQQDKIGRIFTTRIQL